jgi:transcriptional regulator with XRE-family HTH domain
MSDFSRNLALLCSYRRSIADVCRGIEINRQQFNKYLSGQSHPSRYNMRRICSYFGVSESEILLSAARFEQLLGLRDLPLDQREVDTPMRHFERLLEKSQPLDKYVGYYFRYFYSFGNKGYVIRSLASISERDGHYFWKNIETLTDPRTGRRTGVNKYEGIVLHLADRIYFMEYETIQVHSVTQMTVYPCYQQRLDILVGIQTGGPTRRGRKPGASRVALEYLGRKINLGRALRQTGLFDPVDPDLRPQVVRAIRNTMSEGDDVLEVDEP